MLAQLIVDGQIILLEQHQVEDAFQKLEKADVGDVLVALSHDGRVVVKWVDSSHIPSLLVTTSSKVKKKLNKKDFGWLYDSVETEFDHVVSEYGQSLEDLHTSVKDDLKSRGKRPESYRRWISKIKKRWVRTVVSRGRRVNDIEALTCNS